MEDAGGIQSIAVISDDYPATPRVATVCCARSYAGPSVRPRNWTGIEGFLPLASAPMTALPSPPLPPPRR